MNTLNRAYLHANTAVCAFIGVDNSTVVDDMDSVIFAFTLANLARYTSVAAKLPCHLATVL